MNWTGKLEFRDLGTGAWLLHTSSGKTLNLYGEVPRNLHGRTVRVTGKTLEGMGIGMVGDAAVEVSSVSQV
jgi:hypothetical protein